ncbi:MAG TPA: protein-methionine-sulfoxide reductase heme-binding subunit MsrQ [Thiobacillus sp.]
MLAAWLKRHYVFVWCCCHALCALPGLRLWLGYRFGELGINPLETLLRGSGEWALVLLIVTLTITPLRRGLTALSRAVHARFGKRLADWNWIIRLRRPIGLYCFAYAAVHGWLYLHFDLGYDWGAAVTDLREKPYLLMGAAALALLTLLAATSPNRAMRLLGGNWRRLHRGVYAAALFGILHFWWLVKPGVLTPWPYAAAISFLLGYRLLAHFGWLFKRPRDNGLEVASDLHLHGMPERRRSLAQTLPQSLAGAVHRRFRKRWLLRRSPSG